MKTLVVLAALLIPSTAYAQLSVADAPVTIEGARWCNTITRPAPANTTASFTYKTIGGTATAPGDFVTKSGKQSIRKNAKQITVCGDTTDDAVFENDEKFYFEITPTNTTAIRRTATNTIRDNELAPPTPAPAWTPRPTTAWNGLDGASYARATKTCASINTTVETNRVGIFYPGVTIGIVYKLLPTAGWGPNPSWGHSEYPVNINGQKGVTWTVVPLTSIQPITVAQECLEGVDQQ